MNTLHDIKKFFEDRSLIILRSDESQKDKGILVFDIENNDEYSKAALEDQIKRLSVQNSSGQWNLGSINDGIRPDFTSKYFEIVFQWS